MSKQKNLAILEFEKLFGTEDSMGVYFMAEDGTTYTPTAMTHLARSMVRSELPTTISYLGNGGSAANCTDNATYIYQTLPERVEIYGFKNLDNPTSKVAREQIHPGGHDFPIVDKRYIVDAWLLHLRGAQEWIFDLEDPESAARAFDLYGPRECWSRMSIAEHYHHQQLTT